MNVARHASASEAEVWLDHGDEGVVMVVRNGPTPGAAPSAPSTGVGIVGMQERADSVGGVLEARATASGGFEVRAELPYQRRTR